MAETLVEWLKGLTSREWRSFAIGLLAGALATFVAVDGWEALRNTRADEQAKLLDFVRSERDRYSHEATRLQNTEATLRGQLAEREVALRDVVPRADLETVRERLRIAEATLRDRDAHYIPARNTQRQLITTNFLPWCPWGNEPGVPCITPKGVNGSSGVCSWGFSSPAWQDREIVLDEFRTREQFVWSNVTYVIESSERTCQQVWLEIRPLPPRR